MADYSQGTRQCMVMTGLSARELREIAGSVSDKDPLFDENFDIAIRNMELSVRQGILRAAAMRRAVNRLESYDGSIVNALEAFLSHDRRERGIGPSVEDTQHVIVGQAHRLMAAMLENHRPRNLGFSYDREGMRNLVRELRGENTGDVDAAAFAKSYREATEYLREEANRAGADIHYLEDWGTPQYHEPQRVAGATEAEWIDFILPRLDLNRSFAADGRVLSEAEIRSLLGEMYKNIASDGVYRIQPGRAGAGVGTSMASRLGQQRTLHFNSADDWLSYQDRFGAENYYTALVNHVERMGRDIALMQHFGPNPDFGFQYLEDYVRRKALDEGRANPVSATNFARNIYQNIRGMARPGNSTLANVFAGGRNLMVSTRLTQATLSAIPDTGFAAVTARYNGMPVVRTMRTMMAQLNPANIEDRKLASHLGFTAEYAMDRSIVANRYVDTPGTGIIGQLSEATMRGTFLQPWTVGIRRGFVLEFYRSLADNVGKDYDNLSRGLRDALRRADISPTEWDQIRTSELTVERGNSYVNPSNFTNRELMVKLGAFVHHELNYVSPTDMAATRAILNQGTAAGTWSGEILRSGTQFKSFAVTQLLTHLSRMIHGRGMNRGAYIGSILATTTIMGAVAFQAKEIANGREPLDWESPELWKQAMLAGGATGIFADTLATDTREFGRKVSDALIGPLPEAVLDQLIGDLMIGNIRNAIENVETEFGKDAANLVTRNIPLIRAWQFRLMTDRYILDQINREMDPHYFRRIERHVREYAEDDRQYFWRPGSTEAAAPSFLQ